MTRRPNVLIGLGLAVFVIGVTSVLMLLKDDNGSGPGTTADGPSANAVLVARVDVAAGTSGDELIASGRVRLDDIPSDVRAADALTSTAQLAGQTLSVDLRAGEQITASSLRAAPLRSGKVEIPKGREAVAVSVDFVPGGGGYISAGDLVNVFAVMGEPRSPGAATKLVLRNVRVLDVSTEIAPRAGSTEATERASGTTITYLLALTSNQAEQVIFLTSNESVYFSLLPGKQGGDQPTPGRAYVNALS